MSGDNETKKLLEDEEAPGPYGSESPPLGERKAEEVDHQESPISNPVLAFLSLHRTSIPGYGMIKMLKASSLYSLYVLFILLMVYLTNQLDRYTLPIVTSSAGYDLKYGDQYCFKNKHIPSEVFKEYNITKDITDICSKEAYEDEDTDNKTVNVK